MNLNGIYRFFKCSAHGRILLSAMILFGIFTNAVSSNKYDSLLKRLKYCSWEDSIKIVIELSEFYLDTNPNLSIENGKRVLIIAERHNDESSKALAYGAIGKGFEYQGQNDLAVSYYRDELSIAISMNDKEVAAKSYNNIGIILYKSRDYDSALVYFKMALRLREELGSNQNLAKTLNNIGLLFVDIKKYSEAIFYIKKLLDVNLEIGNKKEIANTYFYLGFVYSLMNKYDLSLNFYLKELKLREELNEKEQMDKILNNIGKTYYKWGNFPKAIEYYKKALQINEAKGDDFAIAKSLSYLGNSYYESQKYSEALEYYHRSLDLTEKNSKSIVSRQELESFKLGEALLLNNLGLVYKNLGEYQKALDYCKRSIDIKTELGNNNNIFYPLTSLAEINLKLGKFDDALLYLNRSLDIANETNNLEQQKEAYYLLYEVNLASGNYKSALDNHKNYTQLKDSLLRQSNNKLFSEMQERFESQKKEQENRILRETNELQQKSFIIISILILITLGVTYSRYRSKQKANKMLSEKNKQINHQHKELEYMFSQLQSKEENLREANATKDKFFSIIAHDLKNPLHAIILSSDILINKYKFMDGEQLVSLIKNINSAGNHLSVLLENLLQWSRAQDGKINFQPQAVDLNYIIQENIELIEDYTIKKKILVESLIKEKVIVFADTNMLKTIFRNLLSNAIKFTNENGSVKISLREVNQFFYEIAITDTGIGITKDDINKLFRIDIHHTTIGTSKEKGTGLGLILCKEFVEMNGGKIWVESDYGKGSRFLFTIPKVAIPLNEDKKENIRILSLN